MTGKNLRLYLFGAVFLILATYTPANNGKITPSKCSYTASNKVAEEQCQLKNHKGLVSTKPAHPFFRDDIEKENEIENLEDNLPITGDPVRVGFSYSMVRVICRRKSFDDEVVRKWVLQAKKDNIYANYDLRKEWGSKCPSIREISNQVNCNSCWAVVSTSVMTDRLCTSRNGTNNTDRYSVMDLMTCCTNCVRVGKNALCGKDGIQERAWEYWLHNDIASGGFYHDPHYTCLPYPIAPCDSNSSIHSDFHLSDGNRMNKCEALGLSSYNGSCPTESDKTHHKKTQYFLPRGSTCYKLIRKNGRQGVNSSAKAEDGIKMEIFKYGPVQAVIQSDLLSSYVPGTIFDSKVQDSAHSVRIVGWGEEIGAVQNQSYWIVANSWGSEWGMNGFFHLAFTYKGLDEIYAGRY